MKAALTKLTLILVLAVLICGAQTPRASALVAVSTFETNPSVLAADAATAEATAGTQIATAADLVQKLYEWGKVLLTQTLKKALLDYLVDRVVQYINGNQNGAFVGDWQTYLSGVVATELGEFGQEFLGVNVCSPFSAQLKIIFAMPSVPTFSQKYQCTFDVIGENIEDFYQDFRKGSWIAYEKAWEPQNNIYGIYLSASIDQAATAQLRKDSAVAEATAGAGFLSQKKCTGKLPTPDSGIPGPDIDGDGSPNDDPKSCSITTPGSVIGDTVSKAVGSDFDFIVNSQDLSAYVAAISNAIVGRVLSEGLSLIAPAQASSDPNDYPDLQKALDNVKRSDAQRFASELSRLRKAVSKALLDRKAAKATIAGAGSSWLKQTYGNPDLAAEAISQLKVARQALIYSHNEIGKVIQKSGQIQFSDANKNFCETVKSVAKIADEAMPLLRKRINAANNAIITLEIAEDDLPDLDPDLLNPCSDSSGPGLFDMTCEDNNDQIALLTHADNVITSELFENTEETREKLGDLYNIVGNTPEKDAREFKNATLNLDEVIPRIFNSATNYADRLTKCFTTAVVTPWSNPDAGDDAVGRPARPFPWEKGGTPTDDPDEIPSE